MPQELVSKFPPSDRQIFLATIIRVTGESPGPENILSSKFLSCRENSRTITRNDVVAVFHKGGSFPNLDGAGQSYFSLMGIEYAYQTVFII